MLGMADDILTIAMERPPAPGGAGLGRRGAAAEVLAKARVANAVSRAAKAKAKAAAAQIDAEGAVVASLCLPGAAALLQPNCHEHARPKALLVGAMCRLAVSPKVRGIGAAVDKVRRLQNLSCALVANVSMALQRRGLDQWLGRPGGECVQHRVLGVSAAWDEATQNMQALTGSTTAADGCLKSHKEVSSMVVLTTVTSWTRAAATLAEPPSAMCSGNPGSQRRCT